MTTDIKTMYQVFKPGDTIYGYCGGRFGRDDYQTKTCVMVSSKYAVFENEDGNAVTLNLSEYFDSDDVATWKMKEEDDYDYEDI